MFKNHFIILAIISLLLSACDIKKSEDVNSLENIIPEDKMIIVLADMQLAESYLDHLRRNGHQTKDTAMVYFEKVFKKHDITPQEFESSLLFYKKDLVHMNQIYTNVVTRLNELKAKNEELILQMKLDSIRQDSINALRIADSVNMLNDTIFVNDSLVVD